MLVEQRSRRQQDSQITSDRLLTLPVRNLCAALFRGLFSPSACQAQEHTILLVIIQKVGSVAQERCERAQIRLACHTQLRPPA